MRTELENVSQRNGLFQVGFSCTDDVTLDMTPVALLNGIAVSDGQIVELKLDKKAKPFSKIINSEDQIAARLGRFFCVTM